MCGLAGIFVQGGAQQEALRADLRPMTWALRHRGPDDEGEWIDAAAGVALGFRRLAILDLSAAGHQPMRSESGRYTIVFNGEVYNFEELRKDLACAGEAPQYRGHSDTEVLLASFEAWGVEGAVRRFNGMFAIALWDAAERALHLMRDRIGVKPLFYATAASAVIFGSELKALRAYSGFNGRVDRESLRDYVRLGWIPAPRTIYSGVRKVRPGTIVSFRNGAVSERPYWSLRSVVDRSRSHMFTDFREALDALDALVADSVRLRMISDVPLGVFLSGGIDSSLVTAMMQRHDSAPVKTFTIGFEDPHFDERGTAAAVARSLGTAHTELAVSGGDALALIPSMAGIFDEPFADSSQIPTYIVSRLARRDVVVSLSGDGGDELFGGYDHYRLSRRYWGAVERQPRPVRRIIGSALQAIAPGGWDRLSRYKMLPAGLSGPRAGSRIHKMGRAMVAADPDQLYAEVLSTWTDLLEDVPGTAAMPEAPLSAVADFTERMMFYDQMAYLPDDILTKVDRASMAVSLEAREPLLDYRLIEFAWRLPLDMKIRDGRGKYILRELARRYLAPDVLELPKRGFALPLEGWLRGPLREWAEALLEPRRLREHGLKADLVRNKWDAHLRGQSDWQRHLWIVLMFEAWMEASQREAAVPAGVTC